MEIGLFQLESLFLTPSRHVFLDLRPQRTGVHPDIDKLLASATHVLPEEVEKHLESGAVAKDFPVLLVSEDGTVASTVAHKLESAGYSNVYIVAGGVTGLLSEL